MLFVFSALKNNKIKVEMDAAISIPACFLIAPSDAAPSWTVRFQLKSRREFSHQNSV